MDFSQASQSPLVEKIGDQTVSFSPLTIRDYLPWSAELHTQRKQKSKLHIPANADPMDKFRMARMADFDEPSLDAIAALVWTPAGAQKVLTLSLSKTITDESQRNAILDSIAPRRVISLAVEVSGLFEKRIPDLDQKKQPDPNDGAALNESAE